MYFTVGSNNVKCSQEEQSNILYRRLFWGVFQLYLDIDSWRERERERERETEIERERVGLTAEGPGWNLT